MVGRGVVIEPAYSATLAAVWGALWVFWRWKERRVATMGTGRGRTGMEVDL